MKILKVIMTATTSVSSSSPIYNTPKKQPFYLREEYLNSKNTITESDLDSGFELFITLSGVDGRKLTGNISEIFDSPNFPDNVQDVFFDTSTTLKARHNFMPLNKMVLFLDFRRPEVLNLSVLPSQETQNESNIEIEGHNATWVNGVFKEFFDFVNRRPSTSP